jgi:hypothetical protein
MFVESLSQLSCQPMPYSTINERNLILSVDALLHDANALLGSDFILQRESLYDSALSLFFKYYDECYRNCIIPSEAFQDKFDELLYSYAIKQLYAKQENGYLDCTNLMEVSLLMQFHIDIFAVKKSSSFKECLCVINEKNSGKRKVRVNVLIDDIIHNRRDVSSMIPHKRKTLSDILTLLSYCYQRMEPKETLPYGDESREAYQTLQNNFLAAIIIAIGNETEEQRKFYADFWKRRVAIARLEEIFK